MNGNQDIRDRVHGRPSDDLGGNSSDPSDAGDRRDGDHHAKVAHAVETLNYILDVLPVALGIIVVLVFLFKFAQ